MATQDSAFKSGGTQSAVEGPGRSNSAARGFRLPHHQLNRARQIASHAGVAVLHSLAAHADNVSGKCHTTTRTISRESGVGRKKLPGVINRLADAAIIDRRRRTRQERNLRPGGALEYTIVPTDGPRGFLPISWEWMQKHGLTPAQLSAHALIRAFANGRWKFKVEFDKVRLQLGIPRASFYRLLAALAEHGLVRHYRDSSGHWWELPELEPPKAAPIKRFLAVHQPAHGQHAVSASQVSCFQQKHGEPTVAPTVAHDAANVPNRRIEPAPEAVPSVSKLPHELYKSKTSVVIKDLGFDLRFEGKEELDKNRAGAALRAVATQNTSLKQDQNLQATPATVENTHWLHAGGFCKDGILTVSKSLLCPVCAFRQIGQSLADRKGLMWLVVLPSY